METLLTYYDAHFYIANWGIVRLGLAFPEGVITAKIIEPYLRGGERYEDTLSSKKIGERCTLWRERNEEGGWFETDGAGQIDALIPIREQLMRGDCRSLFLGWLADFHPDEWNEPGDATALMPPVPSGLHHLVPELTKLIEHFPVDPDALKVAATLSQGSLPDRLPLTAVLEGLSVPELRRLLARVAEGGGPGVVAELNRLRNPPTQISAGPTITCADFAAKVIETRKARLENEVSVAMAKRQQAAEQRRQHLAGTFSRAENIWSGLDPLMEQRISSAYQFAATRLQELREAYAQAGDTAGFEQKLRAFRVRYASRPAMLRLIDKL